MFDIGYAGAFLGGIAMLLSPCAALLLPAFFAYAFTGSRQLLGRTGIFLLGLLTALVPLGVAASTLGAFFTEHRPTLVLVLSLIVIGFGILQILGVPLPMPKIGTGNRDAKSGLAVYLLGISYGLAGACSGPILGSVLAVAAFGGDPVYGGVLLAFMGLGMVVPLFILALLWTRFDLGSKGWLKPRPLQFGPIRTTVVQVVSGAIFIALGVLMLLTEGTAGLPGVLDARAQQSFELWVRDLAAGIPDYVFLLVLAAVAGLVVWLMLRMQNRRTAKAESTDEAATERPVEKQASVDDRRRD
ncbi:cytochrome c biogenesis CcdA family protein [Enemella sp. A6]|uniref:cytochrome c biogenesis CcdA family protein n=1 Tax=Enemella sp. A6 TaxID=3440152 RepID=UPI003EC0FF7C